MLQVGDNSLWGIIFFLIFLLVGIACVSVHYRRKYEKHKSDNIRLRDVSRKFIKIEDVKKNNATTKTMR